MPRLSLSLLGPYQVSLDGRPVTGLKSNKTRALLAYLAVEAEKPHHRETLAGLLWPGLPDREAHNNLRYTLSNLRQVIGDRTAEPPFLFIHRDHLQFNPASDYQLDVKTVLQLAAAGSYDRPALAQLEQAAAVYGGDFLEGFYLDDSPAFEEWVLLTREQLARQISSVLHALAAIHEQTGAYKQAQSYTWQQLKLEPWDESAHQRLMRLLALNGQRAAALAQYEICRKSLAEELGVEPARETTSLYERIRDGQLRAPVSPADVYPAPRSQHPLFLQQEPPPVEPATFVARAAELERLNGFLEAALAGHGRIAFITGEAGSGKTTLLAEFSRRAQEARPDLVVAGGNCNAYTGVGDPYLPFREILALLTGDVEARWAAGAISQEHATRLWNMLPAAAQALVEAGPDLIDTFLPRTSLLKRAHLYEPGHADWLARLGQFLDRKPPTLLSAAALQQVDLFVQYTRVMQTLVEQYPLLLIIDDLQWADSGSIHLLFHLGRHLAGSRILILGAYRSEEIALGREAGRHPLDPVINEFRRMSGDIVIDLSQAESRDFIDALLDSEPNRFAAPFRAMLYQQTRGHPLFTTELLRGLQERGDVVHDSQGYWVTGSSLDWGTLPARVEAAIQERVGQLPDALQKMLQVASVEGEDFTAEILAAVLGLDEREVVKSLSSELVRKHRLVRAEAIQRVGLKRISRYRFRNFLFQKYLYDSLDEVERAYLHEDLGRALEAVYGEQAADYAVQLARHFQEAQVTEKAVFYLHQAGMRAVQLFAHEDGIAHLSRGLALLAGYPVSSASARQELDMQLALALAWQNLKGARAYQAKIAYLRARELCGQAGTANQHVQVLAGLIMFHYVRAEYHQALQLAKEALDLAQEANHPLLVMQCRWYIGFLLFVLGKYVTSHEHLQQVIDFYQPQQHHLSQIFLPGSDAGLGAMAYDACCLWCLGYPDQASKRSQQALDLARELDHPFSTADVLCFAGCLLNSMRQDWQSLQAYAGELVQLATDKNMSGWLTTGTRYQGEALIMLGHIRDGVARIQDSMATMRSEEEWLNYPAALSALAEAEVRSGHVAAGLAYGEQVLIQVDKTGGRHWEPEYYRRRGDWLLEQGDEAGAEASCIKALHLARSQQARMLELRALLSLCRLWKTTAKYEHAFQDLSHLYGWFSEGFDSPDLLAARRLLAAAPL